MVRSSAPLFVYECVSTYRVTAPENNLSMILLEDAVRGEDKKKQVNWFKDTETNGYCCELLHVQSITQVVNSILVKRSYN